MAIILLDAANDARRLWLRRRLFDSGRDFDQSHQRAMLARLAILERLALAGTVGEISIAALGSNSHAVRQLGDDPPSALDARDRFVNRRDPAPIRGFGLRYLHRFFDFENVHRRALSALSTDRHDIIA